MKLYNVNDMKRGWFIGDFEPNVIRTKGFEVGYLHHRAGEKWQIPFCMMTAIL